MTTLGVVGTALRTANLHTGDSAAKLLGPEATAAIQETLATGDPLERLRRLAGLADAQLAPHLIRRADVATYLGNSVWPHTSFHDCSARTAHSIITSGAVVERNKDSLYGQAMYASMKAGSWRQGMPTLELAIKTENPFIGTKLDRHLYLNQDRRQSRRYEEEKAPCEGGRTGAELM